MTNHETIRITIYALVSLCMGSSLVAQNQLRFFKTKPSIDANTPAWARMMYAEDPNVAQVDRAFLKYYGDRPLEKDIHTQNYKHWRRAVDPHLHPSAFIRPQSVFAAQSQIETYRAYLDKHRSAIKNPMAWTSLGPRRMIQGEGNDRSELTWQSNVYCIDQSISNPDVLYCGVESGGVFKTTNRGAQWTWASFDALFRTIGAIQIHPTDPNTVYIGSGNAIYKTTDGGGTWTSMHSESDLSVNAIRIHPILTGWVYASTNKGFIRSSNGGLSWTKSITTQCWDVELQAGNPDVVFVLTHNANRNRQEFMKSTDGGATFLIRETGWYNPIPANALDQGGRLTVTPADPNRVYAMLIGESKPGDNGFIGLYRSDDGGETWSLPNGPPGGPFNAQTHPNIASINPDGSGFHQGYYNLGVAASHTDANDVLIGTLSLWKTTDGGASFSPIGGYQGSTAYIHPDQQEIVIQGGDMWLANDGGVNYSQDFFAQNVVHVSKSIGIIGSDYWGFGSGWNEDILVGGRYHNGNSGFRPSYANATHLRLGGAEAATGYVNPSTGVAYFSDIQSKRIPHNPLDAVLTLPQLSRYPSETFFAAHSSELEFDPRCYNHMYIGNHKEIWKSEDGGNSFTLLRHFNSANEGAMIHIEIGRDDPNVIYAYQRVTWCGAVLWRSADGGMTWTQKNFPASGCQRSGTMTLDPTNADVLWVAFNNDDGGKVYKTTNGGNTWENWTSTTLNGHRPHNILLQGGSNGLVYLGTDKTVFYRDNGMSDWSYLGQGLPALVNVNQFQPFYKASKLRVATYGYGMWEMPFVTTSAPVLQPMVDKLESRCGRDTFYFDDFSMIDHSNATWSWTFSPEPMYVSNAQSRQPKVVFPGEGQYSVTMHITKGGTTYSRTINNMIRIESSECDVDGFPGSAMSCVASGDYAAAPGASWTTNELTITAWIKPSGIQPEYTGIAITGTGTAAGFNFRPGNELGYHWPNGAWWWSSGLIIPPDEWSHVAMVLQPSGMTLYLNGESATHSFSPGPIDLETAGLFFGSYQGWADRNFKGLMDEIAIYDRALTTEEVRSRRHLTRPSNDVGLIAYYQFNESQGSAYDKVGSHHAQLRAGATRQPSTAAVGAGVSQQVSVTTPAIYTFSDVGVDIAFAASGTHPNGDVVVSRLVVGPDERPMDITKPQSGYWIINNYGSNPVFSELTSIQFSGVVVESVEALQPDIIQLYKRASNADGHTWNFVDRADGATAGPTGNVLFAANNGITSFSQFIMTADAALPVDLHAFEAQPTAEGDVELRWEIENSVNTAAYAIHRSRDGRNFEEIGSVKHQEGLKQYDYVDRKPTGQRLFYRLKIHDWDGYSEYSPVRVVVLPSYGGRPWIFPNPTDGRLTLGSHGDEVYTLRIFDAEGRAIFIGELSGARVSPDIDLPTGVYIVQIQYADRMYNERLIVQ